MSKRQEKVKQFFDALAENYVERYSEQRPYHQYFFQERLRLATQDLDFNQKTVLDIGAGTGALYDCLIAQNTDFQYFASDISDKMLINSSIPPEQYFVGNSAEIKFPVPSFDFIFLLGVTSYMSHSEFENHLNFIQKHLNTGGTAIISFTNARAIDFQIRKFLNGILQLLNLKKGVLGASFQINAASLEKIKTQLSDNLILTNIHYFNHTFTPANHFFPNLSIRLDKWIQNRHFSPMILSFISADFLIKIKRV